MPTMEESPDMQEHEIVYKFRKVDTNTLSSLIRDEIYYSDPAKFNDPYDCKPEIEYNSSTEINKKLLNFLINRRINEELTESIGMIKLADDKLFSDSEKDLNKLISEIQTIKQEETISAMEYLQPNISEEEFIEQILADEYRKMHLYGIFCASRTWNEHLLWSHYADEHKGICIGYSTNRANKPALREVAYDKNRLLDTELLYKALIEKDLQSRAQVDDISLLRKAPSWAYEQEVRLIGKVGAFASPFKLDSVTFGSRCSDEIKYLVIKSINAEKRKVSFYNINCELGTFNLKRIPLDSRKLLKEYPNISMTLSEILFRAIREGE